MIATMMMMMVIWLFQVDQQQDSAMTHRWKATISAVCVFVPMKRRDRLSMGKVCMSDEDCYYTQKY